MEMDHSRSTQGHSPSGHSHKTNEQEPAQSVSNTVAKQEQKHSGHIAEVSAQDMQQSAQQSTQTSQQENCIKRSPSESQLPLP